MSKRKGYLSFISSLTILSPLLITISCSKKEENKQIKEDIFKLIDHKKFASLDFNKIRNDEPEFLAGVQYTAYSQGISFIFNIARQLGWNWEDKKLIDNLHNPKFDWDTIDIINSKSKSQFDKAHIDITDFEKYFIKQTLFKKGETEYLIPIGYFMKKNNIKPQNHLWMVINDFVWADPKENELKNIDGSTEVVINLDKNFSNWENEIKFKNILSLLNEKSDEIFQHKKYAYNWSGSELKKLAFQISKNKLLVWHYSDGPNQKSLSQIQEMKSDIDKINLRIQDIYSKKDFTNKKLFDNPYPQNYSIQAPKKLSQIWLDPLGVDSTLGSFIFELSTNLKINPQESKKNAWEYFKSEKLYEGDGEWNFINNKLTQFVKFNSFIDALDPGKVILKVFAGKGGDSKFSISSSIAYPLPTFESPKIIQTFYKIKNPKKVNEMSDLIFMFFQNIKFATNDPKQKEIVKIIKENSSPVLSSFLNFLKYNDFKKDRIQKSFNDLNNGSHYMLAVEMFLRGIENIPAAQLGNKAPYIIKSLLKNKQMQEDEKKGKIEGMANTSWIGNFLKYTLNVQTPKSVGNFNPKTKIIDHSFVGSYIGEKEINHSTKRYEPYERRLIYLLTKDWDKKTTGKEIEPIEK